MQDDITEKIQLLRNELEQISIEDTETKDHINKLIQEIENSSNDSSEDDSFIIDKIKHAIERFETEHPSATAILNDIMVKLSNIGI